MDQPRGFDTPEAAFWFPIVTGLQAAGDLFLQLDVPAGFGHVYSTDYVDEEDAARIARRGLWRGDFIPPWEWRQNR